MSVINKMLKDLEKQQRQEINHSTTRVSSERVQSAKFIWILVLVLITFVIYQISQMFFKNEQTSIIQNKIPQTTKIEVLAHSLEKNTIQENKIDEHKEPVRFKVKKELVVEPLVKNNHKKITKSSKEILHQHAIIKSSENIKPIERKIVNVDHEVIPKETAFKITKKVISNVEQALRLWKQAEKQPQRAEKLLRQAIRLDPKLEGARLQLIALLVSQTRLADAESTVDRGLIAFPENPGYVEWKARLRVAAKDPQTGLQWLLKIQPEFSSHINYYGMLATVASQLKHNNIAVETYQKLSKVQPHHGPWLLGLAISQERLGMHENAIYSYKQAQSAKGLTPRAQIFIQQKLNKLES